MKHLIFSLIALSISMTALADGKNKAVIRHNGTAMSIKSDNRVDGRLTDLMSSGGGEDEDSVSLCYEGSPKDVCEILEVAVKEENDKGKGKYSLKSCEKKHDEIVAEIKLKGDEFIHGSLSLKECTDKDK